MHDALTIGVPVVAILAGILLNRQDVNSLRAEMNSRFDTLQRTMDGRFDAIQRDMREFYAEQRTHELRISALEQQK